MKNFMELIWILAILVVFFFVVKVVVKFILAPVVAEFFYRFFKKNWERFEKEKRIFAFGFLINLIFLYFQESTREIILENLNHWIFSAISLFGFLFFSKALKKAGHPNGIFGELREAKTFLQKLFILGKIIIPFLFMFGSLYAVVLITIIDIVTVFLRLKQFFYFL